MIARNLPFFAILEALYIEFYDFLKGEINQINIFSAPKITKIAVLELLESSKLISRKNLSDKKIIKFPHCEISTKCLQNDAIF